MQAESIRAASGLPPTVSVYVYATIRDRILSGQYPPGTRLELRDLAIGLGVSQVPVRESLLKLEAEGFVRIVPHRGASVTELSLEALEEIYLIRGLLDALATRLAVPALSPHTLSLLEEVIDRMAVATESRDVDALIHLNREFHFLIYDASECPLLVRLIAGMWDRSARYRDTYFHQPTAAPQALADHRAILAFCQVGDPIAASDAMRHHIHRTIEGIQTRTERPDPPAVAQPATPTTLELR